MALDDLVDVDFIHEYFDELEASLSLAKEVRPLASACDCCVCLCLICL